MSLSRRQFLRSAAAGAAAFPYYVPPAALGRDGRKPPSQRITLGSIGVGRQGRYNLKAFLQQGDVQAVAVCDVDSSHREMAMDIIKGARGGGCAEYGDFRELLDRGDIDAVVVCTPDHWHGLVCLAAAKAGKDIYCEKPLANTIAEGRAVADTVHKYGRILQVGSQLRSNSRARFACELVRNGRIGKLHTVMVNMPTGVPRRLPQAAEPVPESLDWNFWLGPAPWAAYRKKRCHFHWRWCLEYGGGEITDRGAHVIDMAQLGLGTDHTGPVKIQGRGERQSEGLYNCFTSYNFECTYATGIRMVGRSDGVRGLEFIGDEGRVFIDLFGNYVTAEPERLLREAIGPEEVRLGRTAGHHRNFLDSVRTRGEPMAPVGAGHRTATICHLVNIAMLTAETLQWDSQREAVVNSRRADSMLSRPMRSPWHL